MSRQVSYSVTDFKQAWAEGIPLKTMSEMFGVHPSTVSLRAKTLGLPSRYKGRQNGRQSGSAKELTAGRWVRDARGIAHWVKS